MPKDVVGIRSTNMALNKPIKHERISMEVVPNEHCSITSWPNKVLSVTFTLPANYTGWCYLCSSVHRVYLKD